MAEVSLVISSLALLFTVGSFYWLQARKGRLKLYPVTTFSGAAAEPSFFLRVPIVIYNSGAKPRVVSGIRLRFRRDPSVLLECHTFRSSVDPREGDTEDFAHPYVVPGRNVVTKIAHFRGDGFARHLTDGPSMFDVEIQHDDEREWRSLGSIEVHTEIMHVGAYITYSNNPGVWTENLIEEAKAWRAALSAKRGSQGGPS